MVALTFKMQCRLICAQYKLSLLKVSIASRFFLIKNRKVFEFRKLYEISRLITMLLTLLLFYLFGGFRGTVVRFCHVNLLKFFGRKLKLN